MQANCDGARTCRSVSSFHGSPHVIECAEPASVQTLVAQPSMEAIVAAAKQRPGNACGGDSRSNFYCPRSRCDSNRQGNADDTYASGFASGK